MNRAAQILRNCAIVAGCIAAALAGAAGASQTGEASGRLVVASTLPTAHHRALVEALRQQAVSEYSVEHLVTMGDAKRMEQSLASGRGGAVVVCLDLPALRSASSIAGTRLVAAVPSRLVFGETDVLPPGAVAVETCPAAGDVLAALADAGLGAAPLGLVYTHRYEPSEEFARTFQERHGDLLVADTDDETTAPRACAVDPGACRSLGDIEFALRRTFRELPAGSPLVVYPEGNTLKFAFAFERFAAEKGLVIVGVGDFPSEKAPVAVFCSAEDTAKAILQVVHGATGVVSAAVTVRLDREALAAAAVRGTGSTAPDNDPPR